MEPHKTSVTASGDSLALVELGQILAWLGASCRASRFEKEIEYYYPVLQPSNDGSYCKILYHFSAVDNDTAVSKNNSSCWRKIFNNPTIAKGYPIPFREHDEEHGLEIPLNVAAVLAFARFATTFDERFLLKGPCSALVLKMKIGGSIIWHYVANEDLEPMTYRQALAEVVEAPPVDFSSLEGSRHFIGWTSEAHVLTGKISYPSNVVRGSSQAKLPCVQIVRLCH